VGGGVMVLLSIVLASQTFILPRNAYQMAQFPRSLMTMGVACGGMISAIWLMRRLLGESWLFNRLTLAPPSEDLNLGRAEAMVDWDYLDHKRGVTTTQLTPSGKARFGDEIVNVISDGLLVPNNTAVRVVQVRGNRILVEPLEEN
ncbi:MAG: NfeD family protein, partial [Planctomycetota bacterium]